MPSPDSRPSPATSATQISPIRMAPWEIAEALSRDATTFAYTHVISGSALNHWKESFLPEIERGVLPGRWFMRHGVYTLVAPKELTSSADDFDTAAQFAYKNAGDLRKSVVVVFGLKPGAKWYDRGTPEANQQYAEWSRKFDEWDQFAFAATEGRRNLYRLVHDAHLFTKGGFAGELTFYPILRNVRQIARAVIFLPQEGEDHRKIVVERH